MTKFQTLVYYFHIYPFVRYAFIVGLLIALCASLLGVTLVLKRFSFIGDGLSHVAFGAMAVAAVTGLTNRMAIILPVTMLAAVLLLRTGQNTKIKGDAAIAMISVGALAIGGLTLCLRCLWGAPRWWTDARSIQHQAAQTWGEAHQSGYLRAPGSSPTLPVFQCE